MKVFLALLLLAGPAAGQELELTLERAIALGVEHNLDLTLAQERLAFLEAQRRQAAVPETEKAGG